MLHIAALFVSGTAGLDDNGAIHATHIPMACYQVEKLPLTARVPLVLVVHARAGGDYDPELYVVCKDPAGNPCGSLTGTWHWPDEADRPSKYRCFTKDLAFLVETEGEYTIGAYYDEHGKIEMATPIPISIVLTAPAPADGTGESADSNG
ncbi:hypothetical protein BST11_17550 [Mycobacterium alsense]|uniref:Uncharacterized protein n=1 Tax=Mycobacterium alsense TaxID=324058 RepID=A0AA41XR21_9MYCO|nr:hypothetical protein [Mycobacterium alsense]MCV7380313.1 hypothetical protein [Mycobacterium alsense]OQZ89498.1 hypothetical protein BST11_17550 [Mycobacterium alsense]